MTKIHQFQRLFVLFTLLTFLSLITLSVSGCSRSVTVKYGAGQEITLPKPPQRIVSLAPSNTEILFALGLDDLVVGVTSYCDYPPEAKEKADVGGFMDFSAEKIVALSPDLVLATTGQDLGLTPLLEMDIPVVILDAVTMDEIGECIRVVGELTGRQRRARDLIQGIEEEVSSVSDLISGIPEAERPKVIYVAWDDPILTVGPGTLIHHMIGVAGGRNIAEAASGPYPTLSMESVLFEDPDVILLPKVHGGLDLSSLRERAAWKDLRAVREGRVYLLEDNMVSRPGPRAAQGLKEIAAALHPDLFEVKAP